jgi:hypothetical protein
LYYANEHLKPWKERRTLPFVKPDSCDDFINDPEGRWHVGFQDRNMSSQVPWKMDFMHLRRDNRPRYIAVEDHVATYATEFGAMVAALCASPNFVLPHIALLENGKIQMTVYQNGCLCDQQAYPNCQLNPFSHYDRRWTCGRKKDRTEVRVGSVHSMNLYPPIYGTGSNIGGEGTFSVTMGEPWYLPTFLKEQPDICLEWLEVLRSVTKMMVRSVMEGQATEYRHENNRPVLKGSFKHHGSDCCVNYESIKLWEHGSIRTGVFDITEGVQMQPYIGIQPWQWRDDAKQVAEVDHV